MCFSSPPKDNSAEIARQQENARQARIAEGTTAIDDAFAQFDDSYFQGIGDNYSTFHLGNLDDQFAEAQEDLTANLFRSGNLESSAGADAFGALNDRLTEQQASIAEQARNAELGAQGDVEDARSTLYSQLQQSADPTAASKQAVNQATQLATPQPLSPVAGLFADLVNFGNAGIKAEQQGGRGFGTGLFNNNKDGKGSSKNIDT